SPNRSHHSGRGRKRGIGRNRRRSPAAYSDSLRGTMALAPELTEELRYLEINVGRRIRSLRLGQSRSPLKGFGYEFGSPRKYEVGQDFGRIDSTVCARAPQTMPTCPVRARES